jgi:glucokinase
MLLAGDIGGTKTLLGLFDHASPRPRACAVRAFSTLDYLDLAAMITEVLTAHRIEDGSIAAVCFGVAGPVVGDIAKLTNVPWHIDARRVAARFGFARVDLLNDIEALAHAVPVLEPTEVHVLQEGRPQPAGNLALIAAGTGLGEALLHNVGGRLIPSASEGGHADFAARTTRDIALLRDLVQRYGRADVERVVSGPGLVNVFLAAHGTRCAARVDVAAADAPAAISNAALERTCAGCVEALDLFVEAYGAEAGNLVLRTVATGGVFIGGGIAPKILPALAGGGFMRAFRAKAPFEPLLDAMPVKVILNLEAGLLGAAVYAAGVRPPASLDIFQG